MAGRQHDVLGGEALAVAQHHAAQPPARDVEPGDVAAEAILAAQRLDRRRAGCSTIETRRNVPICGLLDHRISSGAPAATNSSSTLRP